MTTEGEVEENKKCRLYKSWMLNRKGKIASLEKRLRFLNGNQNFGGKSQTKHILRTCFTAFLD